MDEDHHECDYCGKVCFIDEMYCIAVDFLMWLYCSSDCMEKAEAERVKPKQEE